MTLDLKIVGQKVLALTISFFKQISQQINGIAVFGIIQMNQKPVLRKYLDAQSETVFFNSQSELCQARHGLGFRKFLEFRFIGANAANIFVKS